MKLAEEKNLTICTGKVLGDLHAATTFRATRRTSSTRPDHILVSNSSLHYLTSSEVLSDLRGSDHFPIVLNVSLTMSGAPPVPQDGSSATVIRAIDWKRACRIPYVEKLEQATTKLSTCVRLVNDGDVAHGLDYFVRVIMSAAIEAGMPLRIRRKSQGRFQKPFFDEECKRLKREWRRAGRQHGYQTSGVRALERKYHSYVRSRNGFG